MATIQTTFNVVHLDSGLNAGTGVQRTAFESAFSADAIEVLNVDETVALGGIITAKQIFVKLVSGDDLLVGLDGATYPFRLSGNGDPAIFPLDVSGLVETQTIVVTAEDANTTLHQQFFSLEGNSGTWGVWFDVGGGGVDPTGAYDNSLEITGIVAADTIATVGATLYAELIASTAFMADFSVAYNSGTNTITITDRHTGTRTNIADGSATTGFTFATTQAGAASPVIHLKSAGTSQVVITVAPN